MSSYTSCRASIFTVGHSEYADKTQQRVTWMWECRYTAKDKFQKRPFNEVALRKLTSWCTRHMLEGDTKSVKWCGKSYSSTVPQISSIYLVDFGC